MNSSIYEKYMYPYLLSSYVNLTTKSYISLVGILMTSIFIYAILADFFQKMHTENQIQLLKISDCRRSFTENRCDEPVPQIRDFCNEMEKCLVLGQNAVKNVNVVVRLFAEILNEFCNLLSNKAVVVLILLVITVVSFKKGFSHSHRLSIKKEL